MSSAITASAMMAALTTPMWLPGSIIGTIVALSFNRTRTTFGVTTGFLAGGALEFITIMDGGLISMYKEKVLKIPRSNH